MNWNNIRIFLAYLDEGSIASTAEKLKISAPTVSRKINALQNSLGYPLLSKTPNGLELKENVQYLIEDWRKAEVLLSNTYNNIELKKNQKIELRFSTTPALASSIIFPHISQYLNKWPNVYLNIDSSIQTIDISAGQGDIALRFVEPDRGAVLRQKVGEVNFDVFASKKIIPKDFKQVNSWEDLSETDFRAIIWTPDTSISMPQEKLRNTLGKRNSTIIISEYSSLVDAITNGVGIGILPNTVGQNNSQLVQVTKTGLVGMMPLWLVTSYRLSTFPHIVDFRKFIRDIINIETNK